MATDNDSPGAVTESGSTADDLAALDGLSTDELDEGDARRAEEDRLAAEWSERLGQKIIPLRPPGTDEPSGPPADPPADAPTVDLPGLWLPDRIKRYALSDRPRKEPTIWRRSNGRALLYPGEVHSIFGPPGCGKTWIGFDIARQILADGGRFLFLDWESGEDVLLQRLEEIGVPFSDLDRISWICDLSDRGGMPALDKYLPAIEQGLGGPPDAILWDALAGAITSKGGSESSNDDVTIWYAEGPGIIRRYWSGTAQIVLDHVGHSEKGRSRGASSKIDRLAVQFGVARLGDTEATKAHEDESGSPGRLSLRVTKDRHGEIRRSPDGTAAEILLIPALWDPTGGYREQGIAGISVETIAPDDLGSLFGPSTKDLVASPLAQLVRGYFAGVPAGEYRAKHTIAEGCRKGTKTLGPIFRAMIETGELVEHPTKAKGLAFRATVAPAATDSDELDDPFETPDAPLF